MKRRILVLFLAALTLLTLTTTALAAEEANGAYNVQSKTGYTLRVENVTEDGGFYANADTFTLTLNTAPAGQTLVYLVEGSGLPTEENLQYIDQSGTDAAFTLKPKTLEAGKTYRVYVSTQSKAPTETASFSYGAKPMYTLGDVDGSGIIDVSDALMALKASAEVITLDETESLAADVDKNGMVDVSDALMILKYSAEVIKSFD